MIEIVSTNHGNATHGQSKTRLYSIWENMKSRCNNPNHSAYKNYGGRGIEICGSWLQFENFYNWAMSSGYLENLTIDRVNNNNGYNPDNCQWLTRKQQSFNRRDNRFLTYKNKTQTLVEWAEEININRGTLWNRLTRYNWSIEKSFTTPVKQYNHKLIL